MTRSTKDQHLIKPIRHKQSGISLVEILIAMTIGIFLLVGITSSYLTSKKNSIVRSQMSVLEDNGRLALEILSSTLQHTGYTSSTGGVLDKKFINVTADITNFSCGGASVLNSNYPSVVTQDGDEVDDNFESDSLGVIYLGDDRVSTDCAGAQLPASCQIGSGAATEAAKIYSAFYVDDDSNLICVGSRVSTKEIIAEGIENMQILYGLDSDGDSLVDSYTNAAAVEGSDAWAEVVSIQMAVLVRSPIQMKTKAEAETFTLLDTSYTVPSPDRYKRAVFSSTISLRNSIN